MEDIIYGFVGIWMIYTLIHGFILNFTEDRFTSRTGYSKFLTIAQFVTTVLIVLALVSA